MAPTTESPIAYQQIGTYVTRDLSTLYANEIAPSAYQQLGTYVTRDLTPLLAAQNPIAYQQIGTYVVAPAGGSVSTAGDNYAAVILSLNPVAYWPLNEIAGTTFYDATGNGHNAVAAGTVTPNAGTSLRANSSRPCADFAGGYLSVTDDSSLRPENYVSGFSVTGVVRPDSFPSYQALISKFKAPFPSQTGEGFSLSLDAYTDHHPIGTIGGGNSGSSAAHHMYTTINAATNYHYVWAFDKIGGTSKLWINGVEVASTPVTSFNWSTASTATKPLLIGATDNYGGGVAQYFDGKMQDVAYFDYPLTQTDVTALYEGTVPSDLKVWVGDEWFQVADGAHEHDPTAPHVGLSTPIDPVTGRGWLEWTP